MKRFILLFGAFYLPAVFAECVKTEHAPLFDTVQYYRATTDLTGSELKHALNRIIRGHTRYSYTPCVWEILKEADVDLENDRNVIGFYTRRSIPKSMQDNGQRGGDAWNREHIWAKSHGFPAKSQHAYTDAHHLRAADRSVNTDRSDNDFDVGGSPDDECSGCFEGQGTWEPPDIVKGDVARMMFYMDVRYEGDDSSGTPDLELVNNSSTERSSEFGQFGKLCTLMQWHLSDAVSSEEIRRNNIIYSWQGNRNPFIDHPEYAQAIWGMACGVTPQPETTITPTNNRDAVIEQITARIDALESEIQQLRALVDQLDD